MTDFQQAREAMVDSQVRPSDVSRYAIIEAMLEVPRELFVPRSLRDVAYAEAEIPLAEGRVMLQPRTFAMMLQAAQIDADDLVLDVAPGLGYSTAVISRLAAAVVAVEPDASMVAHATEMLARLECDNTIVGEGEPAEGDAEHSPYDVILVNGGVERLPTALTDQLKEGGRLVAVHVDEQVGQCRVTVKSANTLSSRRIFDATAPVLAGFEKEKTFTF